MTDTKNTGSVRMMDLPQIHDPRGDLTFIEGGNHIPFDIARVCYLYNVPVDAERGGHAHRELQQVVFALSGSFRMKIDDGHQKIRILAPRPAPRPLHRPADLARNGRVQSRGGLYGAGVETL